MLISCTTGLSINLFTLINDVSAMLAQLEIKRDAMIRHVSRAV